MKLFIKNGLVHSFNGRRSEFHKKNIWVHDDRIASILQAADSQLQEDTRRADKIIEARDCLVIPGFVNAHMHSHDHLNKAAFDSLPLEIWMLYLRPFFSGIRLTPEEIYVRTLWGCIEAVKTGTTTVMDDIVQHPPTDSENLERIMKAYKKAGVRAHVTTHLANKPFHKTIPFLEEALSDQLKEKLNQMTIAESTLLSYLEEQIKKYNHREALVKYILAPSGPQRCTIELMQGIRELSEKYSLPAICHVLESRIQRATGEIFYNQTLMEYLYQHALLYPNLNLVHCVWVNQEDIQLIRECGSRVIHNPASNLKLGSGIAPIKSMQKQGIPVSLGTDNMSSNDAINMFEMMRLTGLIHNVQDYDYQNWIGAEEAFYMATFAGAKSALLEEEIGSIQENKKADLVILDMNNARFIPTNDYIKHIVYAENGSSVRDVIIDGKIVVENKKITTFDEEEVFLEIKKMMPKIYQERGAADAQSKDIYGALEKAYVKCSQLYVP